MKTASLNLPLAVVCSALFSSAAPAQTYPAKPVTLIVLFATGGSTDIVARVLAHELTASFLAYCLHVTLGQQLKALAPGLTAREPCSRGSRPCR